MVGKTTGTKPRVQPETVSGFHCSDEPLFIRRYKRRARAQQTRRLWLYPAAETINLPEGQCRAPLPQYLQPLVHPQQWLPRTLRLFRLAVPWTSVRVQGLVKGLDRITFENGRKNDEDEAKGPTRNCFGVSLFRKSPFSYGERISAVRGHSKQDDCDYTPLKTMNLPRPRCPAPWAQPKQYLRPQPLLQPAVAPVRMQGLVPLDSRRSKHGSSRLDASKTINDAYHDNNPIRFWVLGP
jgi:hypothetical protein